MFVVPARGLLYEVVDGRSGLLGVVSRFRCFLGGSASDSCPLEVVLEDTRDEGVGCVSTLGSGCEVRITLKDREMQEWMGGLAFRYIANKKVGNESRVATAVEM